MLNINIKRFAKTTLDVLKAKSFGNRKFKSFIAEI
jgi:hypothetical protein